MRACMQVTSPKEMICILLSPLPFFFMRFLPSFLPPHPIFCVCGKYSLSNKEREPAHPQPSDDKPFIYQRGISGICKTTKKASVFLASQKRGEIERQRQSCTVRVLRDLYLGLTLGTVYRMSQNSLLEHHLCNYSPYLRVLHKLECCLFLSRPVILCSNVGGGCVLCSALRIAHTQIRSLSLF